tara:strand:- start:13940 stop:14596 length:657 start_codon:yes stop_codon:yes gene_type:complete
MLLVNSCFRPNEIDSSEDFRKWNLVSFELGLNGLLPIPSEIESIKVEEKKATVITENYNKVEIFFNELYLFDLDLITGISAREEIIEYLVYDWFDIKRGAKQATCKIIGTSQFISELVFYPSRRRDGNQGGIKDCYAKSFIPANLIDDFESSETAALLASSALIKRNGFKGPIRKVDDKIHNLNVVLQHNRRDIYKYKKKYIFSEDLPEHIFCCNVHL